MNKISLVFAIISSMGVGFLLGKLLYDPEMMSSAAWLVLGLNVISVWINVSNIVNYGIESRVRRLTAGRKIL